MSDSLMERPAQLDSPLVGKGITYMAKAQVWCYRRTNGHRSGTTFTTPLLYLVDGSDLVVVASQGGRANHPQWFRNLQATPDAQVQVGAELRLVRARVAGSDERAALWPRLLDLYADFDTYQSWTDREIPVVVLEPR